MSISATWQVAGGSVRGTRHRLADRNNQDGFFWTDEHGPLVLVVTDGCSSGAYSEAGALLGARIVARRAAWAACSTAGNDADQLARAVRDGLVQELGSVAARVGYNDVLLRDYLLFTAVVAVIAQDFTTVFVLGDGVAALNGVVRVVESDDNKPAYPAYALHDSAMARAPVVLWHCATDDVHTVMVGTDGVADLLHNESARLPGSTERLGPVARFWSDDRAFTNPDLVRRRLALANRESRRIDWSARKVERAPGLLPDDTTLIVARRRVEG